MSIDPIFIAGQQLQPTALTPEYKGAYGDFINQMKPATPRKKKTQPEVPGPYLKTKTGMEIMNPGQSADSIQVRQQKAEDEKPKPDNKNTGTGGGGAGSGANIPGGGGAGGNAVGVGTKVSAFTKLKDRLAARGLAGLYDSVVGLIQEDLPEEEFTIRLRETPAYQTRFKANAARVAKGLLPLSEGAYLAVEDSYQNIMRMRGLPESYYTKGALGEQTGFEALISEDVSPEELGTRIDLAQEIVDNNPAALEQLKAYYPEVTNGDLLGYVINPKKAIKEISTKVRSAQIGAEASAAKLGISAGRAEELYKSGVTQAQAKEGFATIANVLPTGQKLAGIYGGEPYDQTAVEQEVFGLAGGIESAKKRRKLASQERAAFSSQVGMAASALEKGRAGGI